MAVNDVYRVSLVGAAYGEPIINTLHYRVNTVGAGVPETNLAGSLTTLLAAYQAVLSADWSATVILVQGVKPVGVVVNNTFTGVGGQPGASAPSQVAGMISKKSATPGRGGRGRVFMGPLASADIVQDRLTAAAQTRFTTLGTQIIANTTNGAWVFTPVIWRRRSLTTVDLTSFNVNPVVRTRRSRALGIRFHRRRRRTVGSI